jgi:hypothetical protein
VEGDDVGPPVDFVSIIRAGPCTQFQRSKNPTTHPIATPHRPQPHIQLIEMSAPCRIAVGAAKTFENSATPLVARRTFASHTSNSTSVSRTATRGSLRCLRETRRTALSAGETANNLRSQSRAFSQSTSRSALKTIDQIKARNKGGVRFPVFDNSRTHKRIIGNKKAD